MFQPAAAKRRRRGMRITLCSWWLAVAVNTAALAQQTPAPGAPESPPAVPQPQTTAVPQPPALPEPQTTAVPQPQTDTTPPPERSADGQPTRKSAEEQIAVT